MAQAVLATLAETDENPVGLTATVQGFGSMGGAAARYLARAGMHVVAVVDRDGVVADPDGLDVETLPAHRSPRGLVDRDRLPTGARPLAREEWLSVPADVMVTAAASYAVDDANEGAVRCGYLVEAANVSVLPSAEKALLARGVIVVPDFLANFAANSWWWWTLFGDVGADAGEALAKIDKTMWRLVEDVFTEVRATGLSPREVASRLAERDHAHFRGLSG
ncbi:hypothetical protein GCM10010294_66000 [Streptomyces griseoloalbus]|nr:hypothetical protein GCM10010294_66000 [Streptomyces griseoloalbus]